MRYERFVELRRDAWEAFERGLAQLAQRRRLSFSELEMLAAEYRRILQDHAVVSARYPGTRAARKVQHLVLTGNRLLSRAAPPPPLGRRLARLLLEQFPATFRRHLSLVLLSLLLFAGAALVGAGITARQPAVGRLLLGPEALSELRDGQLWTDSITTTVPGSIASASIATNNLSVALTACAGGALAGLGSLYILLLNGAFLGAVFAITAHYSLGGGLFEFVAAHGPLELFLIVVCASAGLVLAQGLVVAGDTSHGDRLRRAGREVLVLLAGVLPWFVVLALVESFVSPDPTVPAALKTGIGLVLLAAFLATALRPSRQRSADGA